MIVVVVVVVVVCVIGLKPNRFIVGMLVVVLAGFLLLLAVLLLEVMLVLISLRIFGALLLFVFVADIFSGKLNLLLTGAIDFLVAFSIKKDSS